MKNLFILLLILPLSLFGQSRVTKYNNNRTGLSIDTIQATIIASTLQAVTNSGRYTTNSMRSDSFIEVRHTDALTQQHFRATNPTAGTGKSWDWCSRNNGRFELLGTGNGGWTARFAGNNLNIRGAVTGGPASTAFASTANDAFVIAIDSINSDVSVAAINTRPSSTANAAIKAVTQTGGGDPKVVLYNGFTPYGYFGIDQSDGFKLKIGVGEIVGTNTALTIQTDVIVDHSYDRTITGTLGAVTINKLVGTGNIAAGSSSVVITNSLVDINSIILCSLRTDDGSTVVKSVVPAAGSFTIRLSAVAGVNCSIGFFVIK